jgi:outer membrane protein
MSGKTTLIRAAAPLLALIVFAGPAAAQQGLKIAVIDTELILRESQAGKKALADLKKLQEAKEGELKARQQEIKDLQTKAADGRLSLAEDKLREIEKQLEDKMIAARRLQDDATRELNKRRDEVLAGIDAKVMPIINQVGKEGGYTMIFRKFESGLIFVDEAVDITPQVIQRLDTGAAPASGK